MPSNLKLSSKNEKKVPRRVLSIDDLSKACLRKFTEQCLPSDADLGNSAIGAVTDQTHATGLFGTLHGAVTPEPRSFGHAAGGKVCDLLAAQVEHVVVGSRRSSKLKTRMNRRGVGILPRSETDVVDVEPVASHLEAEDMFTCGESDIRVHQGEFIPAVTRNGNIRNGLSVDGERKACSRIVRRDRGKHRIVAFFRNVHGVFKPFARLVVAYDIAGRLLVNIDARTFAVIAAAVVFGIVFLVGVVARADTRDVEVFGLDLAGNFKRFVLERLLRFGN